jgi:hypothetical protein
MSPVDTRQDLVTPVLASGTVPSGWSGREWSALVRQARAAGLLGRLAAMPGLDWPPSARAHAASAQAVTQAQVREIHREVRALAAALAPLGEPVVLLKGAAYVMLSLPAARGRSFSDIDLLVPEHALGHAESLLTLAGWMSSVTNAYDQRYYREWTHELPPMEHVHRKTTIDVHHNLLPRTARRRPDAAKLLERLVPVPGHAGLYALGPTDMVLHSMTHLFVNDDTSHALRDLSDIDLLLRHFGRDAGFWPALLARAVELRLERHCHDALDHAVRQLGTPVPPSTLAAATRFAASPPARTALRWLWKRALAPPSVAARRPAAAVVRLALLARGHWLRMPPGLLVRHLSVKALRLHERRGRDATDNAPGTG